MFFSQVTDLVPKSSCYQHCPTLPRPLCPAYVKISLTVSETNTVSELKSTSWEENGFIPALLELDMRRENPFQFSCGSSYSGAERVGITSIKVLDYETGLQALQSAEGRKWEISFAAILNIKSLYFSLVVSERTTNVGR